MMFRKMAEDDLPLMHRWLNMENLRDTYADGKAWTWEEVREKYMPRIRGEKPTTPYLIIHEGMPIGYIQTYRWREYPEYSQHLELQEESASLDVFIGEPDFLHRGLGAGILRSFVEEIVFADPEVQSCVITPMESNKRALRAYEKAGFSHVRTMIHPDEDSPVYLMKKERGVV
jgi:RimJ/RimL family protein N-acetyltransferase